MGLATTEITNMQNQTAYMKNSTEKNKTAAEATSDSNMFLTLMLQQLQNQDPTQPTTPTEPVTPTDPAAPATSDDGGNAAGNAQTGQQGT